MNQRNQKYTQWLVDTVRQTFSQQVCLLVAYGSYINGMQGELSDVDVYFVPVQDAPQTLCRTMIIENVGYDIFPISWERLAGFAALDEPLIPLLGNGEVLYARSQEDLNRFANLKAQLAHNLSTRTYTLTVAHKLLVRAKEDFGKLCFASDMGQARAQAGSILLQLADAVMLCQGKYFERGLKRQWEDLSAAQGMPHGFLVLYRQLIAARDTASLLTYAHNLIQCTEVFLPVPQDNVPLDPAKAAGFLQEVISTFGKIQLCAQTGDEVLCFLSAVSLHGALEEGHQDCGLALSELLLHYDPTNLPGFSRYAQQLFATLRRDVERAGQSLDAYETIEDFIAAQSARMENEEF